MPTHVIRYDHREKICWGVLRDGRIHPIDADLETTGALVRYAASNDLRDVLKSSLALTEVRVLSPITRNQQLICLGANYRSHMIESGIDPDQKSFNMVFRKASSAIVPASSDIVRPSCVELHLVVEELDAGWPHDVRAPRLRGGARSRRQAGHHRTGDGQ